MDLSSVVVSLGRPDVRGGPLNTPIVPTAPYLHGPASDRADGDNLYARHDVSPTVRSTMPLRSCTILVIGEKKRLRMSA